MPFNIGPIEMLLMALCFMLLTGAKNLPAIGARVGREVGRIRGAIAEMRYGSAVRTFLALARTEAVRLQHRHVGPEHLLMALTLEPDRATEQVLGSFGVSPDQLRWRLKESLVHGSSPVDADVPYGGAARSIVELAMTEAKDLGHERVDPVHVLLAMLRRDDETTGALRSLGVSLEQARAEAIRALSR
jgi:ATP-dependent Clp protease ATP-binding subunit ClpC